MPINQTELEINDDPHLAEHFISGELVPEPEHIEAIEPDLQFMAMQGLSRAAESFSTAKKIAAITLLGAGGLIAGLVAGHHRAAHS